MAETIDTDLAVIGAGAGGLSVAAGAVQLGLDVVLFEHGRMGGDCLNVGCVPSKALLTAAKAAAAIRGGGRFGVNGHEPAIDFSAVQRRLQGVIAEIAPNDSIERFTGLGVRVVQRTARFTGRREIEAEGLRVRFRRAVIATGSRPSIPPVPGLDQVPYLTNETVFDLTDRPDHLAVLGGGPVGVELAQAFRRLGAKVTLLEQARLLARNDPAAVEVIRRQLIEEGVEVREQVEVTSAAGRGNRIELALNGTGERAERVDASHLLVATGRRIEVDSLGLDRAGVGFSRDGIEVDRRLRTANRRIFAVGDVAGGPQFTHVASHHASVVIKNALFRLPARVEERSIPRVTYCDPELAQVGPTEDEARAQGRQVTSVVFPMAELDRAHVEGACRGFTKVIVDRHGRPLGATIVGRRAGELAGFWVLAIQEGIALSKIAQMVAPYPTFAEAAKRAAGAYFAPRLFSPRTRWLVRVLKHLG